MNLRCKAASRLRPLLLPLCFALAGACGGPSVLAQKVGEGAGGRAVRVMRDSAAGSTVRVVYEGLFSYVRIERAEAGAPPNRHPVVLAPASLRAALATVQLRGEPLFNDSELDEIVPPLTTALGQASPDQDVSFAVPGRHGGFVVGATRSVTSGRLFRDAGGLQLIVGLAQKPFEAQFNATGVLIPFEPGRRAAPVDATVRLAALQTGASLRRGDWVSLSLDEVKAATAGAQAPAAAAPSAVAASAVQAASPAAPAASAPAATPDAEAVYRNVSERLKALARLRDAGLITPQEYEQKRRQILGEF